MTRPARRRRPAGGGADAVVEAVAKRRWHEALGVGPDTSPADLRRAFHKMARKWHPDRCREVRAKEVFQALQHAFEKVSADGSDCDSDCDDPDCDDSESDAEPRSSSRRQRASSHIDACAVPAAVREQLELVVDHGKASGRVAGIAALFHGPSGTGKTLAAEAIGRDLGQSLKIVSCSQLVSERAGESVTGIASAFDEAEASGAILVFDEAERLFGPDSDRVEALLQRIERHPGVVLVVTTDPRAGLDDASFDPRFALIVAFDKPDEKLRAVLFRRILPPRARRAADVDVKELARRYPLTGGQIRSVVLRAAARAAAREEERRRITHEDLVAACDEEIEKDAENGRGSPPGSMS